MVEREVEIVVEGVPAHVLQRGLRQWLLLALQLLVSACSLNPHPMVLLVNPTTGAIMRCERDAPTWGWAWGIGGKVAVENCAEQYENLGYIRSDRLALYRRNFLEMTRFWQKELRPRIERGELTAVESVRILNEKEAKLYEALPSFVKQVQEYRIVLARYVDAKELTLDNAERLEEIAREKGEFSGPLPTKSPSGDNKSREVY